MNVALAFDLGGTSLRSALVDERGETVASHAIVMPVSSDSQRRSEIDPEIWWQALVRSADALAAQNGRAFRRIAAIAISALTRSQVFTGRDGSVTRPAILMRDTRAGDLLPSLLERCPADHPETAGLNAFHPLARLWWLKHQPGGIDGVAHVLDPKDYLNLRLTGEIASDPISLARLAAAARPGPDGKSLFDHAGLPAGLIPQLLDPASVLGTVLPGLDGAFARLAGAPVIVMANDTWASVVGLGAMRAGVGYNLSGTTEVLGILSRQRADAEGLLTVDWGKGLTQIGGPSQSGGDTLMWLLELLGRSTGRPRDAGAALDAVLSHPRDGAPVIFLPYLEGERTPYWDPLLRGALLGLNRRHGAADIAFAVMEGVAFLNRVVLERAEAASGQPISEIRFGGGGGGNPLWRQIKADILNRRVIAVEGEEHGLQGAAIVAWTALGVFHDLDAGQSAVVRVRQVHEPDRANCAGYDRLYALFLEAQAALAPLAPRLAGPHGITMPHSPPAIETGSHA